MEELEKLKVLTLETGAVYDPQTCNVSDSLETPRMFSDEELLKELELAGGDVYKAAYEILIKKSESTQARVADLSLPESSNYFLRLAARCRKNLTRAAARADEEV